MSLPDSSSNTAVDTIARDISNNRINNQSPQWGVMLTIQSSLNLRIGTQAWKKYISAAFWNYISTPINFTITLFTALSAGQTGTQSSYLTERQLFIMLFVSFLLSIINTFFKLKEKAILNYEASKKYDEFGAKFEEIYYIPLSSENDLKSKLHEYMHLQEEINKYSQKESIENVNYFTELIYLWFHCFFEDNLKRINKSDRFWYLDGLTPDIDRKHNPWSINVKEYFLYDTSGQTIYLDEDDVKDKNDKERNNRRRYSDDRRYTIYNNNMLSRYEYQPKYDYSKRNKKQFYDIESNSIDSYGLRKLEKHEIIEDIDKREKERMNENKSLFVKEKLSLCLENSENTIKKINEFTQKSSNDK